MINTTNNIMSETNSSAKLNVSEGEDIGIMAASYLMFKIGKLILFSYDLVHSKERKGQHFLCSWQ